MTRSSSCAACAAGMFEATVACLPCPYNSYEPETASTGCTKCGVGKGSQQRGSTAVSTCTDCAAGKYGKYSGSSCESCPADYYSSAPASSSCSLCEQGTTGSSVGASVCGLCPAGSTSYHYTFYNQTTWMEKKRCRVASRVRLRRITLSLVELCDTIPGGHMSPDGVTVEACDESTTLTWDEGPNREYCKPCRAFFFSDCSALQEDVKSYSYGYSIYEPSADYYVTYIHPDF